MTSAHGRLYFASLPATLSFHLSETTGTSRKNEVRASFMDKCHNLNLIPILTDRHHIYNNAVLLSCAEVV